MIIAIDGTASSGKSSISRELGKRLDFCVLGTGSLYRALTLKLINLSIAPDDEQMIKNTLLTTTIESEYEGGRTKIYLDGIEQDLNLLNSHEVSVLVAHVACKEYVREFVRKIQRETASKHQNIIVEGRDIGSVVFPNADVKLFIDASVTARAERRLIDYKNQGKKITLESVIKEIEQRDQQDRERELSPLMMTSDSILIDTTNNTINDSVEEVLNILKDKNLI